MKKIALVIILMFLIILGVIFVFKDAILSSLKTGDNPVSQEVVKELTEEEREMVRVSAATTAVGNESRKKFEEDPVLVARKTSTLLKSIIEDESVSKEQRSLAVNDLATLYCGFSRNDAVLPEIYTGEYAQFFVEGKPGTSSRNMLEWGYENFEQTPRIAIQIAHHGAKDLVQEKSNSKNGTFSDETNQLAKAKEYIGEAQKFILEGYTFKSQRDYFSYNFWLTFTESSIAYLEGDNEKYISLYPEIITELASSEKDSIKDYIPYAYLHNAMFAMLAGKSNEEVSLVAGEVI